ncbi:energy transducer TonB [Neolewinella agarilytica]|uniref:energy transducer TonB n=1 Tax=Neolewinella agarilytica TaxID=478744 RepID=UPI0023522A78|nr:energy transducer TonB [Neolewinella agarilytica]
MRRSPTLLYLYVSWITGVTLMMLVLVNPYVESWLDDEIYYCPYSYGNIPSGVIAELVNVSPRFTGCPSLPASEECATQHLEDYLYDKVTFPASQYNEGTAGLVVLCIVIKPSGKTGRISLLRDPGHGRGADALRIVREMQANGISWKPATVNGRPVEQRVYIKIRYSNFQWVL